MVASFGYDISNRIFTIQYWLERNGQILSTPAQGIVGIYASDGSNIATLTDNSPDNNGVFWQKWTVPPVYTTTDIFFAKVQIVFSGTTYSSGLTFTLAVSAGEATVQAMQNMVSIATSNILQGVGSVGTSVSNLTSIAQGIGANVSAMNTNILALTNALLPGINYLTNAMTVIDSAMTNVQSVVTNMALDSDAGHILQMATTVSFGSTNRVLYKTRRGYDPSLTSITVSNAILGQCYSGTMTELIPGIYENDLVANWGVGTFILTCSDPRAHDSLAFNVVGGGTLDDVPPMLSAITNRLSLIEVQLANVTNSIKGTDLSGVLASLKAVQTAV